MSRTTLAALRKHRTPAEFVRKFLLPAFRSGRVPAIKELPNGIRFGEQKTKGIPIIFTSEEDPKQIIYFNIIRTPIGRKVVPTIQLFRGSVGPVLSDKDWEEGKKIAPAEFFHEVEEMKIHPGHLNEKWNATVQYHNGKPLYKFYLPHRLMDQLITHASMGREVNILSMAIQYKTGHVSNSAFHNLLSKSTKQKNSISQLFRIAASRTGRMFLYLLRSPNVETTTQIIRRYTPSLSATYARLLAKQLEEVKNDPRYREGISHVAAMLQ